MKAFKNNPQIKASLIAQLEAHYAADEIIKGTYWENGKGCAVGCCVHSADHSLFPKLFDIPESIAILMDSIFEELPDNHAKEFPLRFIRAIPVGSDLSKIENLFLEWILIDPKHGVIQFNPDPSILKVAELHRRVIDGDAVSDSEWDAAGTRAAAWAGRAAAGAAGTDWDADWDAAWAAARAASRAAAWASRAAARDAQVVVQAEKLIELMAAA